MSLSPRAFYSMRPVDRDEGGESEVSTWSGSDLVPINATVGITCAYPVAIAPGTDRNASVPQDQGTPHPLRILPHFG